MSKESQAVLRRGKVVYMKKLSIVMILLLGLCACGQPSSDSPSPSISPLEVTDPPSLGGGNEWWLNGKPVEGGLFADAVGGLSSDFIRGADVSSLLSLEASGVKFYDFDGNEQDMLKTLAEAGFNYIRVRVWVDPYDARGNGYGGGNNDLEAVKVLGERAAGYGMKLLVNFHYSDFWADPAKQQAPKAWRDMTIDEKELALFNYTDTALREIIAAGADVGMVQVGNETTTGFCGENQWPRICQLLAAGTRAVRGVDKDIQIVIHLTNPESHNFVQTANLLKNNSVDYDVFATSYYPFWHGTLDNLRQILLDVAERFDKKVMVAEVAYAYSYEDFDGHGNTIGDGAVFEKNYTLTVQGQARAVAEVVKTVASLGDAGIGVFYWEPGWIPVPGSSWEERSALWEKHGSGWASSFAAEYDPDDAGKWYGGSACDNQALFSADGYPLESLKVFGYCYTGAVTERRLDEVYDAHISVRLRNPIELPETVTAVYNDNAAEQVSVEWESSDLDIISNSPEGVYIVRGTAQGVPVNCHIKMEPENYLENYSFENEDRSMWHLDNIGDTTQLRYQEKSTDAYSGRYSLHFWDSSYTEFRVEQTVTGLRQGEYSFSIYIQGGDDSVNAEMYIYVLTNGEEYRAEARVDGWVNWQQPKIESITVESGEVTVGVYVKGSGNCWGTMDDFQLCPVE